MNPATFITLSTLRLEATGNGASSIGTGFLYNYILEQKSDQDTQNLTVPVILTNKHVLVGRDTLAITVTLCPEGSAIGDRPNTEQDTHLSLRIGELPKIIIQHPSHDIDLCAVPVAELLRQIPTGQRLRHTFIDRATHLSPEESNITRAIEPIVMIGYPSGLWDERNNLPIARRGQTATHPLLKWNNQRKFVIDAACFPGSSGSPVFLYEDGMYRTAGGALSPGTRARL